MNLNKKLVCTAVATAVFAWGTEQAVAADTQVTATSVAAAANVPTQPVPNQPPAPPKEQEDFEAKVLATVDGQPITGGMLGAYLAGRTSKMRNAKPPLQMQSMALQNLISIHLLAKAAHEAGIDTRPGVAMSLKLQQDQLLAQMLLQERASANTPSEEALQQAYTAKYAQQNQEYKACHVLVKTEDEAKKIIEQLSKGTDFAAIAKEKSIDPSANKGGDLGWFEASQMVKPFADAVATMKVGTTSTVPVQSQFGWHVIKLEDKRATTPPEFNSVRSRLLSELQRTALTEYVEKLRDNAKIEMKEVVEQPKPEPATK